MSSYAPGIAQTMKRTVAIVVALVAGVAATLAYLLTGSLPDLDGEHRLVGLGSAVAVERDALGVPTVRGSSRVDLARATGFLHAQDRFFQMDLLRRAAAGELAALVGTAAVARDERRRVHRLRSVAARVVSQATARERAVLDAYVEGVNAGLVALAVRPVEYLLLRASPEPWQAEDTILAIFAMYFELNDEEARLEAKQAVLDAALPAPMFAFLTQTGTDWDAPLVGEPETPMAVPGPGICDWRGGVPAAAPAPGAADDDEMELAAFIGSNSWAVAPAHSASGRAILANDMHLGLRLPNTWYRMRLVADDPGHPEKRFDVTGVTLPGVPAVVAGSNGRVAWGFTNSRGDWSDLVVLELDPEDPDRYRTPEGFRPFDVHEESIAVKGEAPRRLAIRSTIWGPVLDQGPGGRSRALRWLAHLPEATNLRLGEFAQAHDVDEALGIAHGVGMPPQNLVIVDAAGNVAWSIIGRIPRRRGYDSRLPASWADGAGWDGWLAPEEYPVIRNPASGRLWTANARVVEGAALAKIGRDGYALGARARQIRDGLMAIDKATERDMLAIQLDDRALFLEHWQRLLLDLLTPGATQSSRARAELRTLVSAWRGRASVDAVGYRMVREFRERVHDAVFGAIVHGCADGLDPAFRYTGFGQFEGALWKLVTEGPPHLLGPGYRTWEALLLAAADAAIESCGETPLASCTWGQANTVNVAHPLSRAAPFLSGWLDIGPVPLPGGKYVPRVQKGANGASERFAVSPGREEAGFFHMPGGQSGHPLSRYYRAGHEAWVQGEPSPFLPGPAKHMLALVPG